MLITRTDIAKRVGVSVATVSYVLNGRPGVSQKTARRVEMAARELEYRPKLGLRGLRETKGLTIAFAFNFPSRSVTHDISYHELFFHVSFAAHMQDCTLIAHPSLSGTRPVKEILSELKARGVDGVLLGSDLTDEDLETLSETDIPTFLVARRHTFNHVGCMLGDDKAGCTRVTRLLLGLGHRDIVFVGLNNRETSQWRLDGFLAAMNDADIEVPPERIISCPYEMTDGEAIGQRLATQGQLPTAIVTSSDVIAMGVISGLRKHGVEVPEQVSITGFGNWNVTEFLAKPLTTVDTMVEQQGMVAMSQLIRMINDPAAKGHEVLVPTRVIQRDTCIPPRKD